MAHRFAIRSGPTDTEVLIPRDANAQRVSPFESKSRSSSSSSSSHPSSPAHPAMPSASATSSATSAPSSNAADPQKLKMPRMGVFPMDPLALDHNPYPSTARDQLQHLPPQPSRHRELHPSQNHNYPTVHPQQSNPPLPSQQQQQQPRPPKSRTPLPEKNAPVPSQQQQQQQQQQQPNGQKSFLKKEHPPPPPSQVHEPNGRVYNVGASLGKGGFAICHVGKDVSSGQHVALKIVKSKMPNKMMAKFQTELQIHSKMYHRNIVQFYRAFAFQESTFLVLELCPNGSLMDMVRKRKGLTEPEVRFYMIQIAGAIRYMHHKGIIHRDLKMGNIFLDAQMNAKVGDFGLAALVVTGKDMQTIRRTTLCGTPNYIAPEILQMGKKGHDHMVDIWSLGIIMYAMYTSLPPFQSKSADEIYRKASERDYDWPDLGRRQVSNEAKDLVGSMFLDAQDRPDCDQIAKHSFFRTGYTPHVAEITTAWRTTEPTEEHFFSASLPLPASLAKTSFENLEALCKQCQIGDLCPDKPIYRPVWRLMAAEEKAGLTPTIPIPDDFSYLPFDLPPKTRTKRQQPPPAKSQPPPPSAASPQPQQPASTTTTPSHDEATSPTSPEKGSALRAPPQSFAAQQRAKNRPAGIMNAPPLPPPTASTSTSSAHALHPTTNRQAVPARSDSLGAPSSSHVSGSSSVTSSTALKSVNRDTEFTNNENQHPAEGDVQSAPPASFHANMAVRSRPLAGDKTAEPVKARRTRADPSENQALPPSRPANTAAAAAPAEMVIRTKPTTANVETRVEQRRRDAVVVAAPRPSASLFGPAEKPAYVPDSQPDVVLERLGRLQAELERALNARTMAILTSKSSKNPPLPLVVVKWVDYTTKFGLGYILNNGSVGCVLREAPTGDQDVLPPACMMIPKSEQHIQRRDDALYADRHQPIPMNQYIHFYENNGEQGFTQLLVHPKQFAVQVQPDGSVGKLEPGQDIYQHRKRERIVLWKKFANYMIAYGRDEVHDAAGGAEEPLPPPPMGEYTGEVGEVVTFYQRFGDVGCWVFGDGHLQFNFPDHTKVVLDAAGYWCHFWHLPEQAARQLKESGSLQESALDERSVLSYPLQTLLNFQSKYNARSTSTTRRRPEIPVEHQGIPTANDLRSKIFFIKDIVKEWVDAGGIGNHRAPLDEREGQRERGDKTLPLRVWYGARETVNVPSPQKYVWVTVGARHGDRRVSHYVDPADPSIIRDDEVEERRRRA